MDTIIEQLQKTDLAAYKSLIDECFDESNNQINYDHHYDPGSQNYQIIVAKHDGKVVGSLTLYRIDLFTFSFQPAIEVFNVCVSEKYRGQGVAKKLFGYLQDFARNNEYKSIFLTCLETATDAQKLYESLGMVKANRFKYQLEIK